MAAVRISDTQRHLVIVGRVEGDIVHILDPRDYRYMGQEGTMTVSDFLRVWGQADYGVIYRGG